jgi:Ni/Co efflux regulator RcnB
MRVHTVPTLAALALASCIAAGTASAQGYERGRDRDRGDQAQQDNDRGDRGDRRRGRDQQQQQQQAPAPQAQQQPERRDFDRDRDRSDRDRGDRNRWGDNDRRDRRDWGDNRRNAGWDRFRRNFDSPRRYRVGVYRAPAGYNYRRWHYGDRLPRAYYARHFWLSNFVVYGLFAPPPGLIWVRYGPDALLIDQYTGEVVQVRYNVFYY